MVTVDSWRSWCDSVYWADEEQRVAMDFVGGDVVFCKIDEVMRFFEWVRLTRRRVVLVTGQGDFPCDEWRQGFLPANVVHWFATNVTQQHPRITALPLGLGSPSSPTTLTPEAISEARQEARPRDRWLYVNFRPDTNPAVRGPIFEFFQNRREAWISFDPPGERGSNRRFLDQILRHRFVLCPPGNGVDTHRMWESLVAGAIPVVLRSQAMKPFESLPILFVEDYREVTQGVLEEAWAKMKIPEQVPAMMSEDFWVAQILNAKNGLKGRETMPLLEWIRESVRYGLGMVARRVAR
jgi:hypothetical protein